MTGTAAGMQIEENLALAARRGLRRTLRPGIRKAEREEYRQRLQELGLGLDTRLSAKVGTLSGGQRQALTLLMATLRKPKLLLLDEHTAALDPKTAAKVMELTERMVTEEKLSTLMITHNMRDAIRYGNRLIMLHAGRIILDISGQEKKDLTVPELLEMFARASGNEFSRRPGHSGVKPLSSPSTSSGTAGRLPSFITQQGPAEKAGPLLGIFVYSYMYMECMCRI